MISRNSIIALACCVLSVLGGKAVEAAPGQFLVDTNQSKITLSGRIAGFDIQEQGPGSLTTTFEGTLAANLNEAAIQFTGGSSLLARTNGIWQPGPGGKSGSAPADFAAEAKTLFGTVKGALRNIALDVTSGSLLVTNGQFNASALLFAFPTNSSAAFDYDAGFLVGADGIALSGIATNRVVNQATLSGPAGDRTLSIEVDTEFRFTAVTPNDSSVRFVGKLVGSEASLLTISSIQIKDQTVLLSVQGGGTEPRLDSSPDLKQWTAESPNRSTEGDAVVLSLPAEGIQRFYRVSK